MDQSFTPIYIILVMSILASLNSQGLRCPDRRKTAFSFFQRNRLDIILLQETQWTVDMEMQIKREWDGDVIFNHGTNTARGVAILIHSRLECSVMQTRSDNEGRVMNITLDLEERTFCQVFILDEHIVRRLVRLLV